MARQRQADDDEPTEDRGRPRRKKKAGSNKGLLIGCAAGGCLLLSGGVAAGALVLVFALGWVPWGQKEPAKNKDAANNPVVAADKGGGPGGGKKDKGGIDPGLGNPNLVNNATFTKLTNNSNLTLAGAELAFGGPGRLLAGAEFEQACQKYPQLRNVRDIAAGAPCYQWTGKTGIVFLFFDAGGAWRGGVWQDLKGTGPGFKG
jgi:hypothetical protein